MKTEQRISTAYCADLNEIMDIETAIVRSAERNGTRFEFLCAYEECRQKGVKITATNYHKPVNKRVLSPQFRLNNNSDNPLHHPNCPLYAYQQQVLSLEKTTTNKISENTYCKGTENISEYTPQTQTTIFSNNQPVPTYSPVLDLSSTHQTRLSRHLSDNPNNKTTSFPTVCEEHYRSWKDNPIERRENMMRKKLKITGIADTNFFEYFKPVKYQINQNTLGHHSITFGFISPKAYSTNKGTVLYFKTKHDETTKTIKILIKKKRRLWQTKTQG